jgi:hypothetical protein
LKVTYGTTETVRPEEVEVRLRKLRLSKNERAECQSIFEARQVLVVLRDDSGKPYFVAGFKRGSDIGRIFQRLCRPMEKLDTHKD